MRDAPHGDPVTVALLVLAPLVAFLAVVLLEEKLLPDIARRRPYAVEGCWTSPAWRLVQPAPRQGP